jgi:hypothetical protein
MSQVSMGDMGDMGGNSSFLDDPAATLPPAFSNLPAWDLLGV